MQRDIIGCLHDSPFFENHEAGEGDKDDDGNAGQCDDFSIDAELHRTPFLKVMHVAKHFTHVLHHDVGRHTGCRFGRRLDGNRLSTDRKARGQPRDSGLPLFSREGIQPFSGQKFSSTFTLRQNEFKRFAV